MSALSPDILFQPFSVGSLTLPNRIVMPAMTDFSRLTACPGQPTRPIIAGGRRAVRV